MSDLLMPGLGATLHVSAALPANELLASYHALTWTKVGFLEDIPEYGPSHDVVTFVPLETGVTAKYHGAKNNGSMTLPIGFDVDDAGQEDLEAALAGKDRIAFRITNSDGTSADFFQGKVMSDTTARNIGSVVMRNMNIEIETDIVRGAPTGI